MHPINHFLISFTLLFSLFSKVVSLEEIIVFSFVFGVLVDLDLIVGWLSGIKGSKVRSWFQEPSGLVLLGFPLGVVLSLVYVDVNYILLVIIPWGSHIIADYLAFHVVRPLAPFSNKTMFIGWFKPLMHSEMKGDGRKSLSEAWVTIFISFILVTVLLFNFVF